DTLLRITPRPPEGGVFTSWPAHPAIPSVSSLQPAGTRKSGPAVASLNRTLTDHQAGTVERKDAISACRRAGRVSSGDSQMIQRRHIREVVGINCRCVGNRDIDREPVIARPIRGTITPINGNAV